MKKSNLSRRMLACVLSILMVLGIAPVTFAEETTISYVSLGDSMTNGYGLEGYEYEYHVGDTTKTECTDPECDEDHVVFHWSNGFNQVAPDAYPAQVADYFGWDLTQYGMSALRVEDLHWILEADRINYADYDEWRAASDIGDHYTWDEFVDGRFNEVFPGSDTAKVVTMYQEAVENADVISLGTGNANFGVFMLGRLTDAIGFGGTPEETEIYTDLERALVECDDATREMVLELRDELFALVDDKIAEVAPDMDTAMLEALENTIVYAATSFVLNHAGAVEAILKLNDDVEIILVGIMNTFAGMEFSYTDINGDEHVMPLADLFNVIVKPVNTYIAALPTVMQGLKNETYANATFYYAEAPEVDCVINTYEEALAENNKTVRDRFITEIVGESADVDDIGMVWNLIGGMVSEMGANLIYINYDDVMANSTPAGLTATVMGGNADKAMSAAIYWAFEDAIVEASKDATLSLETMGKLVGGLNAGLFAGVADDFGTNLAENTEIILNSEFGGQVAYADLAQLLAVRESMADALVADTNIKGLLHLFGRMLIGNGLGAHPSAAGHDVLTAEIINAYETKHTAKDETLGNLEDAYEIVKDYILEYYDEAYAKAYDELDKNGYIDVAADGIDVAINAIMSLDISDIEMTDEFKAELVEELVAVVATLEEIKAVLENDDAKDVEGLLAAASELEDDLWLHLTNAGALLNQAGLDVKAFVKPIIDGYISDIKEIIYSEEKQQELIDKYLEIFKNELGISDDDVATINAIIDEIKNIIDVTENGSEDDQIALINKYIAILKAELGVTEEDEARFNEIAEIIREIIEIVTTTTPEDIKAAVDAYIEEIKDRFALELAKLGHKHYEATEDSYYVAIGGDTLNGTGIDTDEVSRYHELVAEDFEINEFKLVKSSKLIPSAITGLIDSKDEIIENADFITYQIDASSIVFAALKETPDWDNYFDDETQAIINKAFEKTKEILAEDWEAEGVEFTTYLANEIKAAVLELPEIKALVEDKIDEVIEICVPYIEEALEIAEEKKAEFIELDMDVNEFIQEVLSEVPAEIYDYIDADAFEVLDEAWAQSVLNFVWEKAQEVIAADWTYEAMLIVNDVISDIKTEIMENIPDDLNTIIETEVNDVLDIYVPYIEGILSTAESEKDNVVSKLEAVDEIAWDYAEKFAYAVVSFAFETKDAIELIQEINPEATLVVAGMYNPFKGLEVVVEGDTINLGEYFEYAITASNFYYTALAAENGNFAFVDISETEINGFDEAITLDVDRLGNIVLDMIDSMHANADGHVYIKDQIVNALVCDYSVYEELDESYHIVKCSICGHSKIEEHIDEDGNEVCDKCGYHECYKFFEYVMIDKTSHKVICTVCGDEYVEDHDLSFNTNDEDTHIEYCELCDYESEAEHGYEFYEDKDDQFHVVKCSDCGQEKDVEHDYQYDRTNNKKTHIVKCSVCDHETEEEHNMVDNTCTICGYEKKTSSGGGFSSGTVKPKDEEEEKVDVLAKFNDVDKEAWYYDFVKQIVERGLMKGMSDTVFGPDIAVTRGMFVTIVYRLENEPEVFGESVFTDVAEGQYYADAVKWAYANGIVKGISDTEFAPDAEITREQMAAMIARYADFKKLEVASEDDVTYTDNDAISEYAKESVKTTNKLGVLIGNADGTFAPKRNATRAEVATMFVRLLGILEK